MFWSILVFFFVLSILVIVHEFGHFWVAKRNGIWVEEFGFGLPPRVFGKKIGETIYSINALPFGGFVKLHGELTDDKVIDNKRAFLNKSKKVKIAVIVAGVVMNTLLAIVAFAIVYSHYGIPQEQGFVEVVGIVPNTPAANSKIVVGERIYAIDDKEVFKKDEVTNISAKGGKHILLVGSKDADSKNRRKVVINTEYNEKDQRWYMGFLLTSERIYFPPAWQRPIYGVYYGIKNSYLITKGIVTSLFGVFAKDTRAELVQGTTGPIGLLALVDNIRKQGIYPLIDFMGLVSLNLAVINILPFPALDGGRLLFIFIEKIIGKKILPKVEAIIHSLGMIILLLLILAITIKDIKGLISAGSISGFLENMMK